MVKTIDVADYILQQLSMSAMKLQKLLYYSQAWHLVWEDEELFDEEIQAWANGPVIPSLYEKHRGQFKLEANFFNGTPSNLSEKNKEVIDKVVSYYGSKDAQWLSELTRMESPWKDAKNNSSDGKSDNIAIPISAMQEYYSFL